MALLLQFITIVVILINSDILLVDLINNMNSRLVGSLKSQLFEKNHHAIN